MSTEGPPLPGTAWPPPTPLGLWGSPHPQPSHLVVNSKLPVLEGTPQVTFPSALTHPTEMLCFRWEQGQHPPLGVRLVPRPGLAPHLLRSPQFPESPNLPLVRFPAAQGYQWEQTGSPGQGCRCLRPWQPPASTPDPARVGPEGKWTSKPLSSSDPCYLSDQGGAGLGGRRGLGGEL